MKRLFKNKIFLSLFGIFLIIASVYGLKYYQADPDISGRALTQDEQRSLIDTQRTALLANEKPSRIFKTLEERYDQLSPENKAIAVELMYISQQNATLYYNNMMYIMGGEISANRPKDSMNSLDAGKQSAWVAGYIQDLKNQHLVPINLNEDMILALPDFKRIEKYKDDATPSLRHLIEVGVGIQDLKPYTDTYFEVYNGALGFDLAISKYQAIAHTNANEYAQHILSLARLMHDSIFGYLQTNNIEWQLSGDGDFKVSDKQLSEMKTLSESELSLNSKAKEYLNQVDGSSLSSQYITEKSLASVKEFGQSVYISSAADIDNYYEVTEDGDIEPTKPADKGAEEEVEDDTSESKEAS